MRWILIAFLVVASGCSVRNPDINRSVDPSMDKSVLNPKWEKGLLSPEWYYRLTIVDTPTNTKAAGIGEGHWLHPDTIRWEITEKYLIGWRAHASVPGSEGDLLPGATEYRGVPVVVFKIVEHFDIFREMDTMTQEFSNILKENTSSHTWDKRRFMRVDWSRNLANIFTRQDDYDWTSDGDPGFRDTAYAIGQNDPGNPKHMRVEDDYMEITTRQGVKVDLLSYYGGYGEAYREDGAAPIVDTRMSFLRKTSSDYEPLHYPDYVTIGDGKPFSKKMPIWEKFGFYRSAFSGQQTWNAQRGSVESGKNYNITRFNIWQSSMRDGVVIPIEQREPKPIIYYTNVLHPDSLLKASRRVEAEWNQTFKELVFYAQPGKYKTVSHVPDMWILRENSCRVSNVDNWLKKIPKDIHQKVLDVAKRDLDQIRIKIADSNNPLNAVSFTKRQDQESQAKADLERICSALEFMTKDNEEPFRYERVGDLRYNLLNLVTKQALTAWSGLGPMLADVLTGEIVQATANVNLWYIDRRAALASEQIDIMMGNVPYNDMLMGTDVRQYMSTKLVQIREASKAVPSKKALNSMGRHFDSLSKSGLLLESSSVKSVEERLSKISHTRMEAKLLMSGNAEQDQFLPMHQHDFAKEVIQSQEKLAKQALGIADPPEFVDHLVLGVALRYRDLNKRERFERIREDVYMATMLHEVGHNMGMAHNMSGSSDSVNYGKTFWDIQALPTDMNAALVKVQDPVMRQSLSRCLKAKDLFSSMTTADCLGQSGTMYSSMMDYHATWNSDLGGLGPYDKAAIKFAYAQLAEVFPRKNLKVPESQDLSRWLFLKDWRQIPTDLFVSPEHIHEREHVKYAWGKTSTNFKAPTNEVPYRYCIDSSGAYGPTCKAFDFGPDMRAQAEWNQINYWQYYALTHFARDRLWGYDWDFQNVVNRDLSIFVDFNNIMRWYYYYSATDPEFKGSDAEKDYLAAVVAGLNHYGHVLGHPAPGDHASTPVHLVESLLRTTANSNRLDASKILLPWGSVDACTRLNVSQVKDDKRLARPGYLFTNVALGDGRPFYVGLNHDYEDWHVNFVGSFYSKLYAGYFLAYPGAWFPRTDTTGDPRFYNINWHRLFPNEVSKLFKDIISQNWTELGPVVSDDGIVSARNLLDPVTLQAPDYAGKARVLPSTSTFLPYRAMYFASAMLSGYRNSEMDLLKSMRVSLKGSEDDLGIFDSLSEDEVATYVHPVTGYTYRASKTGEHPIAYELVRNLDILKNKYQRLNQCLTDQNAQKMDPYCRCVRVSMPKAKGGGAICCHPQNPDCSSIALQPVGGDSCSMRDLTQRRDRALEDLEDATSYLDDMRWFVKLYSNMP